MKKITFIFALLCASVMGFAAPYCEKVVTTTVDYNALDVAVTVKKQNATTVRVILDNEHITGIRAGGTFQQWGNGVWANQDDAVANFAQGWTQDGTAWYKDFVFSTYPTTGNFQIYILMDHNAGTPTVAGFTLSGVDIDNDCTGGSTPEPEPAVEQYCQKATGHLGNAEFGDPNGRILLTLTKLSDSSVGVKVEPNNNGADVFDFVQVELNGVAKTLGTVGGSIPTTAEIVYDGLASLDFNINVLWHNKTWADANGRWTTQQFAVTEAELCPAPAESEYCGYEDPQTIKNGKNITLTWITDESGNVVIMMGNGTGTSSCSFRNGGFEGGIGAFVVSDDDFATTTPASDYFTAVQVYSGNTYTLTKIADLPANAKIKHVGSGHALAWVLDGNDEYCFPDFIYTYGSVCSEAPVLTSIALTVPATIAQIGADVTLTATPLDQFGTPIEATVNYEISPAGIGSISGNVFTFAQTGVATITASVGTIEKSITLYGVPSDNLALNKDCEGGYYDNNPGESFDKANDGNTGTQWVTYADQPTSKEWWYVDLGDTYSLTAISVLWGDPSSTSYKLYVRTEAPSEADKADDDAWDEIASVTGIGVNSEQFNVVNAVGRYVRIHSLARTGGFIRLKEVRVYGTEYVAPVDNEKPEMTSATVFKNSFNKVILSVAATDNIEVDRYHIVDAGNSIDITPKATDGKITISGLTEQTAYNFTVTAKDAAGNESDNSIVVPVTTIAIGEDLALNKPCEASGDDGTNLPANAVDANEGSLWSAVQGETGDLRVYDAWLTVDLGGFYDINKINIRWEGACSKHYHIDFSANKTDWRVAYDGGWDAVATHWEEYFGTEEDNTKVRYVRVFSTEAVSQYGIKIMALRVYGIPWVPAGDAEKPEMVSASLESNTYNSAIINVAATDDYEVMKYHVVDAVNGINAEYTSTDGKITITGLAHSTEYHMTITAIDAASKESDNSIVVDVTTPVYQTAPATAAPVPAWPADQVKSLYSDTYEFAPASLNSYNECWWDCPNMAEGNVDGNHYLNYDLYRNGMIGVQFADVPVAIMEKIHIDIWSSAAGSVTFRPITAGGPDNIRKTLDLAAQQWNSFDLDMSEFDGHIWSDLYQYTFENYSSLVGEHICVDNVYFYRTTPYVDDVLPTNASASLVATGFYSVTITAQAEDNSGAVNFSVMDGENEVATGAAASGVATTITVANLTPGTAYNFNVIAKDEAGNAAAPIAVAATTKAVPASAPAPVTSGKVIVPVYSDALAGALTGIHTGGWGESTQAEWLNIASGDQVFYMQNFNWAGWHSWGADIDASNMMFLHVDVYSTGMTQVSITPISHDPTHEGSAAITLTPNAWTSYDVPLSAYAANNIEWNKIFQFKFMNPVGGNELMIDNVYFWSYQVTPNAAQGTDAGGWATFASPVDLAVPAGLTAYKASYQKTETEEILNLSPISVIPANAGVILKGTAGEAYTFAPATEPAPDMSDNVLVGCVTRTDVSAERATKDIFCMRYSGSYDFTGFFLYEGQYVPANRAYLPLDKISGPNNAPRKVRFVIKNEQTATGVENTNADSVETVKYLENGQMFIRRGEAVYNLQGIRVK